MSFLKSFSRKSTSKLFSKPVTLQLFLTSSAGESLRLDWCEFAIGQIKIEAMNRSCVDYDRFLITRVILSQRAMFVIMKTYFIIDVFNLGYSLNNIHVLPHPRVPLDEIALHHKKTF